MQEYRVGGGGGRCRTGTEVTEHVFRTTWRLALSIGGAFRINRSLFGSYRSRTNIAGEGELRGRLT